MNVACDEYAGEAAREHMECPEAPAHDILQPPYEGSKAMLKIGDLWITSDYDNNIHFASTAPALRKYCRKRHKWDNKTMELINWNMIDSIRKKQNWSDFVRSMKLLHGWLPIMHNLGKYKHITQCPGCECPDETFLHLFNCSHHLMAEAREDALEKIRDTCRLMKIADSYSQAFLSCIKCGIKQTVAPVPKHPHELATAVKHQNRIGTHKMLQGYLAKSWGDALRATGYKGDYRLGLTRLHKILWEHLFQRIWDTRNYVLKKTPNQYNTVEDATLEQKLNWYRENRHTVLSLQDRHLANIDSDEIKKMGRLTRRKWIKHLDRLHDIHKKQNCPRDEGQPTITNHFNVIEHRKCSRRAGTRKARQPQNKKKRLTQSTLDNTITVTKRKRRSSKGSKNVDQAVSRSKRGVQTRLQFTAGTAQPQRKDRPRPPEGIEPD